MATFRPGKPWLRLQGQASQSLPVATTTLAWATTIGADGDITIGASSVTIDKAGLYVIGCNLLVHSTATSKNMFLRMRHNSSVIVQSNTPGSAAAQGASVITLLELAVGDVIDVTVQVATTATTVDETGTFLFVARVGPVRWT